MSISKKHEQRKNEIIDVAASLFTTKGYAKTTINDILKEAEIAKGTFYHYFQSKEEVMDAVVMRFIHSGVATAKTIANNPILKAPEKLFHIIMAQGPNTIQKEQMIEELHQINNAEMHQKSLVETILQLTPVLTEVIHQGVDEGAFQTPYPQESIEVLLVASQFLFDEGIFHWKEEERMQKAKAFTYIMENTLGATAGTFQYLISKLEQSSEKGRNDNE